MKPKFLKSKPNTSKKPKQNISSESIKKDLAKKAKKEKEKNLRKMATRDLDDQEDRGKLSLAERAKESVLKDLIRKFGMRVLISGDNIDFNKIEEKISKGDIKGALLSTANMIMGESSLANTIEDLILNVYINTEEKELELEGGKEALFYTQKEAERIGIEKFEELKIIILQEEELEEIERKLQREELIKNMEEQQLQEVPSGNKSVVKKLFIGGAAVVLSSEILEKIDDAKEKLKDPQAEKQRMNAVEGIIDQKFGRDKNKDQKGGNPELLMQNPGMGGVQDNSRQPGQELYNSRLKVDA